MQIYWLSYSGNKWFSLTKEELAEYTRKGEIQEQDLIVKSNNVFQVKPRTQTKNMLEKIKPIEAE